VGRSGPAKSDKAIERCAPDKAAKRQDRAMSVTGMADLDSFLGVLVMCLDNIGHTNFTIVEIS
jgi:hypothetical protein